MTLTFTPFEAGFTTNQLTTFYRINDGPLIQGNSVTLSGNGFYNVAYVSADPTGHRRRGRSVHRDRPDAADGRGLRQPLDPLAACSSDVLVAGRTAWSPTTSPAPAGS